MRIVILAVILAGACTCGRGDRAVNSPAETRSLATGDAVSITAPSVDSATTDKTPATETINVDLAGTRIRLVNSSGGSLIAINKPLIIIADWSIRAWRESDPETLVDITSLEWRDPLRHERENTYWRVMLHCDGRIVKAGQIWDNLPRFTDKLFVATTYGPEAPECDRTPTLTIHNYDVDGYPGGGMKLVNNTFQLLGTTFFRAPTLTINYHPVAEDSTMIDHEVAWLDAILEDRNGYWPAISRALPVQNYFFQPFRAGEPLVVPPDYSSSFYHYEVLDSLEARVGKQRTNQMGDRINLHIAMVSNRLTEKNYENGLTFRGGVALLGYNISTTTQQIDRGWGGGYYEYTIGQSTLIHEIGHCFGMGHTQDDVLYPLYPSIALDRDGYLIRTYSNVDRVDRHEHVDVMASAAGAFNPWVSSYAWNRIVSFLQTGRPSVAARAALADGQLVTWDDCY